MSAKYRCSEGHEFDEPHRYVEMHGFTYGPGEHWAVCPYCGEGFDEIEEIDEFDEDDENEEEEE